MSTDSESVGHQHPPLRYEGGPILFCVWHLRCGCARGYIRFRLPPAPLPTLCVCVCVCAAAGIPLYISYHAVGLRHTPGCSMSFMHRPAGLRGVGACGLRGVGVVWLWQDLPQDRCHLAPGDTSPSQWGQSRAAFDRAPRRYARKSNWRKQHPVRHLANEESDTSRWAFPTAADF